MSFGRVLCQLLNLGKTVDGYGVVNNQYGTFVQNNNDSYTNVGTQKQVLNAGLQK